MKNFEPQNSDNNDQTSKLKLTEDKSSSLDFANKYKLAVANQLDSPSSRLNLTKTYE